MLYELFDVLLLIVFVFLLCCCLDEASCTGCCWLLDDVGVSYSSGFLCVSSHYLILPRVSSEKAMAPHSSVLAWRIPGTGEPGGLLSMGSHRVGHE